MAKTSLKARIGLGLAALIASAGATAWYQQQKVDGVDPSITFDFLNNRYALNQSPSPFGSAVTFSRASSGTYLNSAGVLVSAANNVARFNYDPYGQPLGVLMEGAATNLAIQSGFSNTGGTTVNFNATGIDGLQSMSTYTEDNSAGQHFATGNPINTLIGTTYIVSTVVQYGSAPLVQLFPSSSASSVDTYANFNLVTGALTAVGAGAVSAGIEPLGKGFFRIWCRFVATGTGGGAGVVVGHIITPTGTRAENFAGTGRFTRIGFAQFEAGQFMTSIILTPTVAATRASDVMSLTTSAITQGLGTIYAVFDQNQPAGTNFPGMVSMTDGTANNAVSLYMPDAGKTMRGQVRVANVTQYDQLSSSAYVPKATAKLAMGYENNNTRASANGALATAGSSVTIPTGLTIIYLGGGGVSSNLFGHLKEFRYYPVRALDASLQTLTTLGTPLSTTFDFTSYTPPTLSSYARATTNEFYRNSAGKFVLASSNQPRNDCDFNGNPIGFRTDAPSTNKCTNTNWNMTDLTGVTIAGNVSATVTVSTHPIHGHPTLLIDNTLGGSGSVSATIAGAFGNTNVHSMRTVARILSGALTGTFISDSGGSFVKTAQDCGLTVLDKDGFIFNEGFTPTNTARTMRFVCAIGCKAHFWLNQLEEMEVSSFPLLVAGATATRTAAAAYQNLANIATYNEAQGTVVVEAIFDRVTNLTNQYLIQIANGVSTTETLGLYAVSGSYGQVRARTAIASGSQTNNDIHCPIRGKRFPVAFAWKSGQTLSVGGGMSWNLANYAGSPTGMTRLNIAGRGATEPFQGWIKSITVFDQALTLNQLTQYMFPAVRMYRGMNIEGQSNGHGLFRSTQTKQNGGEVAAVLEMDKVYLDSENWALRGAIDGAAADRANDGASGYTNWYYDRATGTFGPTMEYAKSVMTAFGLNNILKCISWDQGATDAADTIANLKLSTKAIFDEFNSFLGTGVKFVIHPIARRQDNGYDIYETVKAAQRQLVEDNPTYIYEAPPQNDIICGSDNIHLSNASYGTEATKLWRKMLSVLGNTITGAIDPITMVSASRSGLTLTVNLAFPTGITAITPTTGILGLRAFNGDPSSGGSEIILSAVTAVSNVITATLATTPTQPLYVQYARGGMYVEFIAGGSANPIANLVRGNDANGLGLTWNKIVAT